MHIVSTEVFRTAAEAISALRPCLLEGRVTADQVKIALGEFLDVWPEAIFEEESGNIDPKRPGEAPQDEEDAEFVEFGNSASREPDFISEEEDERPLEAETDMDDLDARGT